MWRDGYCKGNQEKAKKGQLVLKPLIFDATDVPDSRENVLW